MKKLLLLILFALTTGTGFAQQNATMKIDATKQYQHITGFGGFVCSPQFQYNHMSTTDIKKVWGPNSTVGCNIMRLYIPIGKNAWSQSLATAKQAKQMGLIIFASPWGQPAEWKTNGTSNAKNSDGTTGKLKRENWPDYAQYLEDYVQYLRRNGVELDAISIQNEPDWPASYAGCLWDASEIAEFVKTYGKTISCKVMAPETLAVSDSYANALNKSDILDCFDIYGGHQYGGIQSAYKKLAQKGKEIWMTEYLINWNESEGNERNFDFSKDFFNFFRAINTCMLGDFNAWIHYAAKRYYGMLGDGQRGAGSSGTVTKRGYVMAHFARFITGMTRVGATLSGAGLEGSSYLSQTGDTVVAVLANTGEETVELTLDLPFYTQNTGVYTTTKAKNFIATPSELDTESCRPVVTVAPQSVCTVMCIRSRDRQPSDMTGSATRFDRLDDMTTTKSTFGSNYKLSGKTKKFDSDNPLISSRTNAANGYVQLNDRYSQLVMHIKKVTTTSSYTSGGTTLTYVNMNGGVSTHDYGRIDLSRMENFDMVFDLSPQTLEDGCIGIISLKNDNAVSHLSITFGDVYLGTNYAAKLGGAWVDDDSYVQDYTTDAACTSIDLTAVTTLPAIWPWLEGTNRVAYVTDGSPVGTQPNIVAGNTCNSLVLTDGGGDFRPAKAFTATAASLTAQIDGYRLFMVPFSAQLPEGVRAYVLSDDLKLEQMRSVPAYHPVLIEGLGEVTLTGQGEVEYRVCPVTDAVRGSFVSQPLYAGDYVLGQKNGEWGFCRLDAPATLPPFGVYAQLQSTADFLPLDFSSTAIHEMAAQPSAADRSHQVYNLMGQRVDNGALGRRTLNGGTQEFTTTALKKNLYIINGKKIIR